MSDEEESYGIDLSEIPEGMDTARLVTPALEALMRSEGWHEVGTGESVETTITVSREDDILSFEVK